MSNLEYDYLTDRPSPFSHLKNITGQLLLQYCTCDRSNCTIWLSDTLIFFM